MSLLLEEPEIISLLDNHPHKLLTLLCSEVAADWTLTDLFLVLTAFRSWLVAVVLSQEF